MAERVYCLYRGKDQESILMQKNACHDFAEKKGWNIVGEEQEIGVSGYKVSTVPFPVSWTVKMKKKQKETQDILSYHSQAAGCSDKARAKASGGRQPIEECGRTGL